MIRFLAPPSELHDNLESLSYRKRSGRDADAKAHFFLLLCFATSLMNYANGAYAANSEALGLKMMDGV